MGQSAGPDFHNIEYPLPLSPTPPVSFIHTERKRVDDGPAVCYPQHITTTLFRNNDSKLQWPGVIIDPLKAAYLW